MIIPFLFAALIPFAITGIIAQLGYYDNVKGMHKWMWYTLTILITASLFYLPLLTGKQIYFLWLFWTGLLLSLTYFIVKRHQEELRTNLISRLFGCFILLGIMIACYVILKQT